MSMDRRQFMVGCSSAIAALAGARITDMIFADELQAATNDEILVVVSLRGGCDGLSLITPFDDPRYVAARPLFHSDSSASNVAHKVFDPKNSSFTSSLGFHHRATPLQELYASNNLAIVHAAGLTDSTRSHFDAIDYIERGTPGNKVTTSGWITRHLEVINAGGMIPSLSTSGANATAFLGQSSTVAYTSPSGFAISTWSLYNNTALYNRALREMYSGNNQLENAGKRTLEVIDVLNGSNISTYVPDYTYPTTPSSSFYTTLRTVAQTIKLDLGLRVATIDLGGWDTHESQGVGLNGLYSNLVAILTQGLHAFYNDMSAYANRLTIVVMSEFGRRLGVNVSGGTDHGHGNVMFVIGGKVNGGKVYGQWPGLEDLDQKQDLKITTDYRTILSEILIRRFKNNRIGYVFPNFTNYSPLGITGTASDDLAPDYSTPQPVSSATPTSQVTPTTQVPTPTTTTPTPQPTPSTGSTRKIFLPLVRR